MTDSHIGKVLLVDDDERLLRALQRQLSGEEITIQTATSASSARELCDRHDFDVIVTDHQMPEVSGIEFLEGVRELDEDVVLMILSGKINASDALRAINRLGVFRVFSKPCNATELAKSICEAVELKRLATLCDSLS